MPDNYTFKDGTASTKTRAAKEIELAHYNKDIEVLESGSPAKTCEFAHPTYPIASDTPQIILPANPNRKGLIITNTDPSDMYIKYDIGVDNNYRYTFKIPGDSYWEMPYPIFLGVIEAVWRNSQGYNTSATELV